MAHKPIWSEGVLISQHHFQQQDRYHEQLLRDRLRAAVRYDWGITEIEFDTAALATGQFRLRRFSAIWSDGASIDCGGSADVPCPPARSFDPAFAAASQVLEVFVGLAHDAQSEALVSRPDGPESNRRFLQGLRAVRDVNDGAHELELEYARPNLRIFLGREPQHGYSTIRVAELVRDHAGKAMIRDTYVPPVLRVTAAPFVQAGVHRVLTRAIARQRQLAAERRRRQGGHVEFHATDAQRFWLLHTLNGAIPLLTHLLDAESAHPEEVYLVLSTLAGQLSSFVDGVDPTALPKFNYLSLGEVFESLFARVLSLLSADLQPAYRDIELEHRSDGMYLGKLNAAAKHELFVAVKASMAEALLRERAPKVLKIADWGQIYDVVKQARHGIRSEVEWNPSAALPIQPGTCFFRIRKEGPFWKAVEKSMAIALYLPSEGEWSGASVSLYAIDPIHLT
jgi:type VI secretion system protein ImpJ